MPEIQNFQNHTRWFAPFHFVLMPFLLFNFIWQAAKVYREPSWDHLEMVLLAVAFLVMIFAARIQALKAQNRIIRLEEKLRYANLLPPDLLVQTDKLTVGEMIALRFASDRELPDLVSKVLKKEFKNGKEIKMAIKDWRSDHLRV